MGSYDLVIFDCDGVLVDSEMLSCQCLADVLHRHGVAISVEDVFQRFLGRSSSAVSDYYLETVGRPLPSEFGADLRDHLTEIFERSLAVMPDVPALLESIRQPYCLATSSDVDRVKMTLRVSGLDRYFDGRVFTASMVAHGKPAPDLFLLAASSMGATPQRALVVEDSVNGVLAGKRAGMTVWGFIGGSHYANRDGRKLLTETGADRIVSSINELMSV